MANLALIRSLCKEKNISLKQLGEAIGINTPQGIQRIINQNSTTIDRLEKISKLLEIPIWKFFELEPEEKFWQEISELKSKITDLENYCAGLKADNAKKVSLSIQHLQEIENLSANHRMDQSIIAYQANLLEAKEKLIIEKERTISNLEKMISLLKEHNTIK